MKILRKSQEYAQEYFDAVRRRSLGLISPPNTPEPGKSPQNSTSEDSIDEKDKLNKSKDLMDKFLAEQTGIGSKAQLEKLLAMNSVKEEKIENEMKAALKWIKHEISVSSRGHNSYTKLLVATVLLDTETEAINAVRKLRQGDKIKLVKDTRRVGPTAAQALPIDALRLAALSGRYELLRELISIAQKNGLDYVCIDSDAKWSLAHFLALQSDEASIRNNFPELVHLLNMPNIAGATPLDFIEWRKGPSPVSVRAFATFKDFVKPAVLKKTIGHFFWKLPCFSPAALLRLACETPKPTTTAYLVKALHPKIAEYIEDKHTPSKIQIRKLEGKKLPSELQDKWEAVAAKPLMRGEVIALYSGKVFDNQWCDKKNQPGDGAFPLCGQFMIDPQQGGGSLAEFINHGFPNCAPIECLYKGMPVTAIIALDPIDSRTVLCMQNGSKFLIKETPFEPNEEGRKQFLKKTKKLENISKISFSSDNKLVFCAEKGKTALKHWDKTPSDDDLIEAWSNTTKLEYLNDDPKLRKKTQLLLTTNKWV